MPQVEERVDRLEQTLQSFITSVGIEFNKLYNSQMRTEAEIRAFKDGRRSTIPLAYKSVFNPCSPRIDGKQNIS
jgi:hypothetical protein